MTLLLLLLRPEPEAGRDLLIIWCVGGGKERDTDSYTDTLPGPGEASLSRPLIGHTQHVAALSLVRCYQWASAWAWAAHWGLLENSDQGPQMILYQIQMYFSFSIFPVLFHVTVINFTRFPLK